MSHLTGHIIGAVIQAAIENQSGAQSGSKCQKYNILTSGRSTILPLRKCAGIGIILQINWYTETFLDVLHHRYIVPTHKVRRIFDQPLFMV